MRYFLVAIICFAACNTKKHDEAIKVFNRGVAASFQANKEFENNKDEEATKLNRQAIDLYKQTLGIDSGYIGARSALAHSLYVDKQFKEAINWFSNAIAVEAKSAVNYREMGLSKLNIGELESGKDDIDHAFSLDTSETIKKITIQDLKSISNTSVAFADDNYKKGEAAIAKNYLSFSVSMLMLAHYYDSKDIEVIKQVVAHTARLGDNQTSAIFQKKLQQAQKTQ